MTTDSTAKRNTQRLQRAIVDGLEEVKAQDIKVFNTTELTSLFDQLRQEVQKSGVTWESYLANLRKEVRMDLLRQRTVDSTIVISDAEVDAFLKTQGTPAPAASQPRVQQGAPAEPQQSSDSSISLSCRPGTPRSSSWV